MYVDKIEDTELLIKNKQINFEKYSFEKWAMMDIYGNSRAHARVRKGLQTHTHIQTLS